MDDDYRMLACQFFCRQACSSFYIAPVSRFRMRPDEAIPDEAVFFPERKMPLH
jgi:hypothetical protein